MNAVRLPFVLVIAMVLGACSTGGLLIATPKDGGDTCELPDDDMDAGCDAEDASGDGS